MKETGGIYWPAKLFGVHGQEVNVSLFGEHSSSTVQAKNCLLYSESSPNRIPQQPGAYNDAMKVSGFLFVLVWTGDFSLK